MILIKSKAARFKKKMTNGFALISKWCMKYAGQCVVPFQLK